MGGKQESRSMIVEGVRGNKRRSGTIPDGRRKNDCIWRIVFTFLRRECFTYWRLTRKSCRNAPSERNGFTCFGAIKLLVIYSEPILGIIPTSRGIVYMVIALSGKWNYVITTATPQLRNNSYGL